MGSKPECWNLKFYEGSNIHDKTFAHPSFLEWSITAQTYYHQQF